MKNLNLRAIFGTRKFLALLAIVTTVAVAPSTASARGSVHIDLPSFSLGVHDRHGYRNNNHGYHNNRQSYRSYKRNKRNHYRSHRRNYGNYYGDNSYYYNDGYNTGYRDYRPRTKRYQPRYTGPICPIAGFSTGYDEDRGCYSHKDHFHCDS